MLHDEVKESVARIAWSKLSFPVVTFLVSLFESILNLFVYFSAPFNYRGWEYTGMDQDEEEEDFAEEEEEEEEEEEDIYNKDKKKIFGDTNHYCPVMLKDKFVLWPGIAECAAKYRERTYFFSSTETRSTFLEDPESFIPNNKPLEVRKCQELLLLRRDSHLKGPGCFSSC